MSNSDFRPIRRPRPPADPAAVPPPIPPLVIETPVLTELVRFLSAFFGVVIEASEGSAEFVTPRGRTIRMRAAEAATPTYTPLGTRDFAATTADLAAAGFTVITSPTHPDTAGHVELGGHTVLITESEVSGA